MISTVKPGQRRLFFLSGIVWILLFSSNAFAQELATPTEFTVTLKKVELCQTSTCSNATLLGESSTSFDIASGNAAAEIGNFPADFSLPQNTTFTHMRVTVAKSFTLNGTAPTEQDGGGNACITGVATTASSTSEAVATTTANGATATSQTFVVPDTTANNAPGDLATTFTNNGIELVDSNDMTVTIQFSSALTTSDSAPTFDVAFDVSNTLTFQLASATACTVVFGAPTVAMTFQ